MTLPHADPSLLTVAEMGAADRGAMAAGVPGTLLMDRAGFAVARAIMERFRPQPVSVVCGPGNNGGDGFVAARYLAASGWPVRLFALTGIEAYRGDAAHHAALWSGATEPGEAAVTAEAGIVVDALFGAGLDRPLSGLAGELVAAWQQSGAAVVAVDVPSGLDGDSGQVVGGQSCPAAITVTFCRPKPGHLLQPGKGLCGTLVLADIGIPDTVVAAQQPSFFHNGPALWGSALKWRSQESHKYSFGSLLLRGGGRMTGAGRLAARAALRVGAGLVTVAAPRESLPTYALSAAAVILSPNDDEADWRQALAELRHTAVLVGPGNGLDPATRTAVLDALSTAKPCLLDADAISIFAGEAESLADARQGKLLLTPHEGEFSRLCPELTGSRVERAEAAAKALGAVILLKGSDTIIAAPDGRVAINDNAPPGLAVAGAGDVLSGLAAGLLAQGLPTFEAAAAAVWMHGAAADGAVSGLLADDLPDRIAAVLESLRPKNNLP